MGPEGKNSRSSQGKKKRETRFAEWESTRLGVTPRREEKRGGGGGVFGFVGGGERE